MAGVGEFLGRPGSCNKKKHSEQLHLACQRVRILKGIPSSLSCTLHNLVGNVVKASANSKNKRTSDNFEILFMPKIWQEREDSNPRPLVLETSALARLSYAPALFSVE